MFGASSFPFPIFSQYSLVLFQLSFLFHFPPRNQAWEAGGWGLRVRNSHLTKAEAGLAMLGQCFDNMAAFLDRWAFREGDTQHQILTKRVCTCFNAVGLIQLLVALPGLQSRSSPLRLWSVLPSLLIAAAHLIYLRLARRVGTVFLCTMSLLVVVIVLTSDLSNTAETGRRMWPFAIILIDILLVVQAPSFLTRTVVSTMCVYLMVIQAEATWRFGIFDLPIFASYEDRHCYGTCNEPPCAREFLDSLSMLTTSLVIFLLDFYFTRGFAMQVQREKEKIAAGVTAAQHVAERLASFDLDAAEHVLENQEDMPPDLCESLRVILSHLRAYKPFLPQSVFAMATVPQRHDSDTETKGSCSSLSHSSIFRPSEHAPTTPPFVERRLSLLHLQAALPDVAAPHYTSVHSQMLATVLKHAATCKGVVDHFCGDAVSLSYNASSLCARHPMMAVQTAAALCLGEDEALPFRVRGGVATGHARVGTMGVPELQRHCIVGMLDTVCQHIVQAAVLLERPLLCLHSTAVDVAFSWQTRVLLHRLVFDIRSLKRSVDNTEDPFGGSGSVVYEVVAENVVPIMDKSRVSIPNNSPRAIDAEWMYELEAQASSEWDAYNRAGLAFHRSGGDAEAALDSLRASSTNEDHIAMFSEAALGSRVLDFRLCLSAEDVVVVPREGTTGNHHGRRDTLRHLNPRTPED